MVLLTSSTVSAIVSIGVICIFSLMLFLAGYVVQQQSVKNIQHALRPMSHERGSTFQSPAQKRGLSDLDLGAGSDPRPSSGENYAYLQLLASPDPSDICSTILFFKQLAINGSAIQDRLFMYPEEWDRMSAKELGKPAVTALSFLRDASRKYGIWLLPIDMTAASSKGYSTTDTKLLRLGQVQFMQYDSVLYLPSRGMILDTKKLDNILLSQALPLVYDQSRPDSYDNLAWTPMTLRPDRDANLPPVYLITVNNVGSGNVQARTHVPSSNLPEFQALVRGSEKIISQDDEEGEVVEPPAYVYFESDRPGYELEQSSYYQAWRAQRRDVCEGLDLDDVSYRDEQ